jgi:hypothetical protein
MASEYPPTYQVGKSTQSNNIVGVTRGMQLANEAAVLDITYTGPLLSHPGLSIWVKVNYSNGARTATFALTPQASGNSAEVVITGGCLVSGSNESCATPGTQQMKDLLAYAQNGTTLNALNMEVAFFDGQGNWDNYYGSNYHIFFPQQ